MSQIDDGGPAFDHEAHDPVAPDMFRRVPLGGGNLTLRDWFAGQALAGELAHQSLTNCDSTEMASECYRLADAMLAARKGAK